MGDAHLKLARPSETPDQLIVVDGTRSATPRYRAARTANPFASHVPVAKRCGVFLRAVAAWEPRPGLEPQPSVPSHTLLRIRHLGLEAPHRIGERHWMAHLILARKARSPKGASGAMLACYSKAWPACSCRKARSTHRRLPRSPLRPRGRHADVGVQAEVVTHPKAATRSLVLPRAPTCSHGWWRG